MPYRVSAASAGNGDVGMSTSRSFVGRLFVPLWVCIGLVLAMLVAGGQATAATRSRDDGASTVARTTSARAAREAADGHHGVLCRDARDPSAMIEVAETEDDDTFEAPTAASDLAPAPASSVLDRPLRSAVVLGRPLVPTGLGRGPPRARR